MLGEILVYRGEVSQLIDGLDKRRSALERAYVRVLGPTNAQKLADVAKRTLNRESFFDTTEALAAFTGREIDPRRPNVFSWVFTPGLDDTDMQPIQRPIKVTAAPIFYVSEAGVDSLNAPRHPETVLTSFIHNYNKFVWFAVQDPPMLVLAGEHSAPEAFAQYLVEVDSQNLPLEEKELKLNRAATSYIVVDLHDYVTDLLDRLVLDEIGVRVDLGWRHKPRGVASIQIGSEPSVRYYMLPQGGDPFYGTSMGNARIVRAFANEWHTFIHPKGFAPDRIKDAHLAYVESVLKHVSVEKVPITRVLGSDTPS